MIYGFTVRRYNLFDFTFRFKRKEKTLAVPNLTFQIKVFQTESIQIELINKKINQICFLHISSHIIFDIE